MPPESLHDVQKLTGCMAALSRFISRLGIKRLPFFKLIKNKISSNGLKRCRKLSKISKGT
jgi:hypothetical protein